MKINKITLLALCFLIGVIWVNKANAQKPVLRINPDSYVSASSEEWGQLMWNFKLFNQPLDEFTNFDEPNESGLAANRFIDNYAAYFISAEQYHKFPAWTEVIQPVLDRVNMKLLQKFLWQYWNEESAGITKFQPNMDRTFPTTADPVGFANIMYSGHLLFQMNLYQSLYRDMKWDIPGSVVLKWDDYTQFVYDNRKIQELIAMQFLSNPVPGVECERNAVFSACNQFPLNGMKLYDEMHGTRYFAAVAPLYKKWFEDVFIDPQTNNIAWFYLIKQKIVFSEKTPYYGNKSDSMEKTLVKKGVDFVSAGNDGAVGTFMHAWNPELIEKIYPALKKKVFSVDANGLAKLHQDVFIQDASYSYFTCLVAEMGDEPTKQLLIRTMDSIYQGVWLDGTYHYAYNENASGLSVGSPDAAKKPGTAIKPACCESPMKKMQAPQSDVSNQVIGLARALPKNGMWMLVNKPFDDLHFNEPALSGVDVKNVMMKRAIYDRTQKAIIVSTLSNKTGVETTIKVIKLNPAKTYNIFINTEFHKEVKDITEYDIKIDSKKSYDIVVVEKD